MTVTAIHSDAAYAALATHEMIQRLSSERLLYPHVPDLQPEGFGSG